MNKKLILLVEDDPRDCELTCMALGKTGIDCQIDTVHDGAELVDYLFCTGSYQQRQRRPQPHLILLDLKMPKLDGLQVLRMLRRARSNDQDVPPPIVVLTSSDETDDIVQAYALGANSYIRKPIDYASFHTTIQQIAKYWLSVNEPPVQRDHAHAGGPQKKP